MDIIKTIGNSRKYTFHSHTQFCDGRAPMADFAAEAVRRGFTHYGFSPHSPVNIPSPCNMLATDVSAYLAEVRRLDELYDGVTHFYAGMEIDYLGDDCGPATDCFRSLGLDYSIGSVHFIPAQDGTPVDIDGRFEAFSRKMHEHFHDDIRYVVETFYEQSCRMVEAGGFDILGHLDKIGHNASSWQPGIEDEAWYQALVDDYIDLIIDRRPIVEINTKQKIDFGRIFPSERLLPRLIDAGLDIIVNSDAHLPALIDASRDYAFGLIDNYKSFHEFKIRQTASA